MKVLVTGGTGFLGKHLQKEFAKHSDLDVLFPSSKDCNLLNYQSLSYYVFHKKPDVIFHAAAICGGIKANSDKPATFLTENIQMGLNVFECAQQQNVNTVYTLGSVCSYPVNCSVPFSENNIWEGYPEKTNAPYGHAKRTLLMLGNTYRDQFNIQGAHLIPVNLMGEYDNFNSETSHVIPALIRKFDDAITNNKSQVQCWGSGMATREFLYAGDCAEAIVKAVKMNLNTPDPINLGTGNDISIFDLANLIGYIMEFNGKIVFTGEVSDGQPKRQLDVSRAKELIDFTAKTNLSDGLKKTINWYKENKNKI